MMTATFYFDRRLDIFFPRVQQGKPIRHEFSWRASIKDMVESLGVPHAEVEGLVVNSAAVDFNYIVRGDDEIRVYAWGGETPSVPLIPLRPPLPLAQTRFILDTHLGRLAAYLRMMGFDTLYRNDYDDEELARVSAAETRILLTRDVGLLKRGIVTYGYFVRELAPRRRLEEIITRFNLAAGIMPFRYCMKCNGVLASVPKAAILERLPHETGKHYEEFHQCLACNQIYWKGPHYIRMQALIEEVLRP